MIAASPNCRSRSSSSVFLPSNFANALARFVAVTVLPVPPFGEKTVRIFPWRPPTRVGRLADREDDVLDQLREQQDVGDLGLQRLLEHDRRPAGSDDQNRGARLITNGCELIRRQTRAPGRVEDGVQVAARQGRSSFGDCDACADQLELRMTREGLAQLLEA